MLSVLCLDKRAAVAHRYCQNAGLSLFRSTEQGLTYGIPVALAFFLGTQLYVQFKYRFPCLTMVLRLLFVEQTCT